MGGSRSRAIGATLFFLGATVFSGTGEKVVEYPNDLTFILSRRTNIAWSMLTIANGVRRSVITPLSVVDTASRTNQDTFHTAHEFISLISCLRALVPTAADGADGFDTLDFFESIASLDPPSLSCNMQTLFSLRLAKSINVQLPSLAHQNIDGPFQVRANITAVLTRSGRAA